MIATAAGYTSVMACKDRHYNAYVGRWIMYMKAGETIYGYSDIFYYYFEEHVNIV